MSYKPGSAFQIYGAIIMVAVGVVGVAQGRYWALIVPAIGLPAVWMFLRSPEGRRGSTKD
jgi:hypothetical protein